jgi:hypothetical protein
MIGGGSLDDDELDNVILNVRGKEFRTTIGVLHRVKKTFFSPLSEFYIKIDRSHEHFEHILKYMEDGSLPTSSSLENLLLLKQEFEFYSFELPPADPRETIVLVSNNRVTRIDVTEGRKYDMSSTNVPNPVGGGFDRNFIVSLEGKIYIIGNDKMDRYDPVTDTFDNPPNPTLHYTVATTTVGAHLYVFGHGKLQRYSTESNIWEEMEPNEQIMGYKISNMCTVGTDIYVFSSDHEYVYDTRTNRWRGEIRMMPVEFVKSKCSMVVVDGLVYMTSRQDSNDSFYQYDPRTRIYTELSSRHVCDDDVDDNDLYDEDENGRTTIVVLYGTIYAIRPDGTESYDVGTDRWTVSSTNRRIIGLSDSLSCSMRIDPPFMQTKLDDLVDVQQKIWNTNQLQIIVGEERSQCGARCKSGKRCRNAAREHGDCHRHHGLLCVDGEDEREEIFHLGTNHHIKVSAEALFHIPKKILDRLTEKDFTKSLLVSLLCLQNVLLIYPPARSPPTLSIFSSRVMSKEGPTWTSVRTERHPHAGTDYRSFQGNLIMTGGGSRRSGGSKKVKKCSSIDGGWERCSSMSVSRTDHSVAVVGSKMYVIGGDVSTTSVEVFDGVSWTDAAPLPEEDVVYDAFYSAACAIGSKIYLFGGAKVYCYHVDRDVWTVVVETGPFESKMQISACLVGDKIYIKWFYHLVVFDPATNTFGEVQQDGLNHVSVVWNEKLYGLGLDDWIKVYDVDTRTWERTESVRWLGPANSIELTTWCPEEPRNVPWLDAMILTETDKYHIVDRYDIPLSTNTTEK